MAARRSRTQRGEPALQGPGGDESGPALGDYNGCPGATPARSAGRGRDPRRRNLHSAVGGRTRTARPVHRAEVAAPRRADAVLAGVGDRLLEYSAAALRARSEGGQARKIHRFRGSVGTYLRPEIELGAELRGEAHHRCKWFAGAAAESGERP